MNERRDWFQEGVDKWFETQDVKDLLEGFENELKENDEHTDWMLRHCMMSADNLVECVDNPISEFEERIQQANEEAKLLRKYGYDDYADMSDRLVAEVREYLQSELYRENVEERIKDARKLGFEREVQLLEETLVRIAA